MRPLLRACARLLGPAVMAFAALAALSARPAAAQPVNAEVLQTNLFQEHWSGSVDGSLALARGNVSLVSAGAGARVQYQTLHPVGEVEEGEPAPVPFLRQRVFLRASASFSAANDARVANQGFGHLRWTGMWHPRVGPDVFMQHQYNEFQRLRLRSLFGAGARFDMVHLPEFLMWGATGYMFERERIDVEDGAPDAEESIAHRWASYLTMRLTALEGKLLIQNTVFVQPRFDALDDMRLLEELEVMAKLSDEFSFGTTFSLQHDTRPPTGVKRTDARIATTFRLAL